MNTKTIRAILIQPETSGQVDDIEDSLDAFRRVVGGYVERVGAAAMQISLWVNDNLRDLPVNRLATALWWYLQPRMAGQHQLHGAVIVTGEVTPSGARTSVPSWMGGHLAQTQGRRGRLDPSDPANGVTCSKLTIAVVLMVTRLQSNCHETGNTMTTNMVRIAACGALVGAALVGPPAAHAHTTKCRTESIPCTYGCSGCTVTYRGIYTDDGRSYTTTCCDGNGNGTTH